jgi:hypothetical protein
VTILSWVINARVPKPRRISSSAERKYHMKALLEYNLPEEKHQFETAAHAETWRRLLHGLIKDLTSLCQAENAGQPTARQIQWLINYTEMKLLDLKIDSGGARIPDEPDGTSQPVSLAGISSAVLAFEQTEHWLSKPYRDFGASPLRVICACGSTGAKLVARELEKMEAELEATRTRQP